jgi:release factor glutamine methyltransferase
VRGERAEVRGEQGEGVGGRAPVTGPSPHTPHALSPLTGTSRVARLGSHAVAPSRLGPHSVGEAVEGARRLLERAGLPDPRREAAELYGALVRRSASAAWLDRRRAAADGLASRLHEAAERRAAGWPQAYAAGAADFRGHWLEVDGRVLIPRPETEGLVELVLEWVRGAADGRDGPPTVVDVGTGSGAIAVALAVEAPAPGVRVIATDRSSDSLAVARRNVAAHGVSGAVRLLRAELLDPIAAASAVVSNPPYVTTAEWERLDPGVRDYEPRIALDGGSDGLAVLRPLIRSAFAVLRPGGLLVLEVDDRRARATSRLAAAAGFVGCEVVPDLFHCSRYVRARRPDDGSD